MMSIKTGEYYRTRGGYIALITGVIEDPNFICPISAKLYYSDDRQHYIKENYTSRGTLFSNGVDSHKDLICKIDVNEVDLVDVKEPLDLQVGQYVLFRNGNKGYIKRLTDKESMQFGYQFDVMVFDRRDYFSYTKDGYISTSKERNELDIVAILNEENV